MGKSIWSREGNNWLIRWASQYGHVKIVRLLSDDGRNDPSADNNYAIGLASRYDHIEVVELLLGDNYAIKKASKYVI